MRCCIVKGCRTRAGSQNGKSMFHMPLGSVNCQIWLDKLCVSKVDFLKTKAHKRFVCSDHFDEDSFEINYERELLGTTKPRTLKPNATPLQQAVVTVARKPNDLRSKLKTLESRKKGNYRGFSSTNVTCVYGDSEHTDASTQTTITWDPNAIVDVCSPERSGITAVMRARSESKRKQGRHQRTCKDPQWASVCIMALMYALSDFS